MVRGGGSILFLALVATGCRTCDQSPLVDGGPDVDSAPVSIDAEPLPDAISPGDNFSSPATLAGFVSPYNDSAPALTEDLLELVFISDRPGNLGMTDLWSATRTAITEPWGAPVPLSSLSSSAPEDHPWLSADGLTLYFSSGRAGGPGGFDIYTATRAARADLWGAPMLVTELSIDDDDFAFAPSANQLTGVLDRDRNAASGRDIYITTRSAVTAPWGEPATLTGVSSLTDDITPFLADGGKALYWSRGQQTPQLENILFATRPTTADLFGAPIVVPVVSSDAHDLDPWLAEDQRTIYFTRQIAPGRKQLVFATR